MTSAGGWDCEHPQSCVSRGEPKAGIVERAAYWDVGAVDLAVGGWGRSPGME